MLYDELVNLNDPSRFCIGSNADDIFCGKQITFGDILGFDLDKDEILKYVQKSLERQHEDNLIFDNISESTKFSILKDINEFGLDALKQTHNKYGVSKDHASRIIEDYLNERDAKLESEAE